MPTTIFISVYALFNIYMYLMAYLYSPIQDLSSGEYSESANKSSDHDTIMNQFYEQELPEIIRESHRDLKE